MRCLLFLFLVMSLCQPLFAEELCLITENSNKTWRARKTPQKPATAGENLALQAVDAKATVKEDMMTANYLGQKDLFDIVTVEEAQENTTDDFYYVINYQIRDRMIYGDTKPIYMAKPNPEKEKMAREIGTSRLNGGGNQMPVFIGDRMYVVEYVGKSNVNVIEKDDNTVHFTYRYRRCN